MALGDVIPLDANRRGVDDADVPSDARAARPDDDLAVMWEIHRGSHEAFSTLLRRYWPRLIRYADTIVGGRDRAQDVVQEAFVRVWQNRSTWEPRGTVSAYLYRITRNLALNSERERKSGASLRRNPEAAASGPRPPRDPDIVFHDNALRREVEAAIASLPERRREVFVLARFHRLSYGEIAEALEISRQTVANQMSAALASLRDQLSGVRTPS
ncbi:MAG: RNA polymerase sigma-70 factor [Gemmatimonadota bacterium]|nr:RNA polymerase sigma-70 factor [Gemmatimonadota bacterium]